MEEHIAVGTETGQICPVYAGEGGGKGKRTDEDAGGKSTSAALPCFRGAESEAGGAVAGNKVRAGAKSECGIRQRTGTNAMWKRCPSKWRRTRSSMVFTPFLRCICTGIRSQ